MREAAMAALLAVALSACSGSPGEQLPTGAKKVNGVVTLPAGSVFDLAKLEVVTPYGAFPVDSGGRYSAVTPKDADSELAVQTEGGDVLLLGVSDGAAAPISAASTAEALLYYLVGGMWLPADEQDMVRDLLRDRSEIDDLAPHVERLLGAGENGLMAPDQDFQNAIQAAYASLLADAGLQSATIRLPICPALFGPAQVGQSVIIHDGTSSLSGAKVLHSPEGVGVVAYNELRRPAALIAYEVSWEDDQQVTTLVEPPVEVARVDVPATDNLELFAALLDVVTGDAPWAPVLSPALVLPGHDGASSTQYELVLIGPSLTSDTLPISSDPRFTSLHDEWEDVAFDKNVELFLDEMLIPLLEVYGFGQVAKLTGAKLSKARAAVKQIYDSHLLGLGVFLKTGTQGGYAAGLKFVLEELAVNKTLRSDTINMLTEAFDYSERNKHSVEVIDARLASHASAAAIAFAVEAVMVGGDVTKILTDLASTPEVASWAAESFPARFLIDPPVATITKEFAQATFRMRAVGDPPGGRYRFRWTTSGDHGELDDLMGGVGTVVDTQSPEIYYFHNDPVVLSRDHMDTILMEVFIVENGVDQIPEDAKPIGKGQAMVRGEDEGELCVWTCEDDGLCTITCPE